ncbi:MAG TPA: PAS-domain containing protein [Xanthobacteraceae bacterium]|nr:PAS-domain containing protein [Xanthobacteraceae bacterium]
MLSISRSRPITLLVVCGLVLIVALAAATALVVASMRAHILADSERELSNTAHILAEQAQRTFAAVDAVEGSLIERMQQMGIASRADVRRMAGADVHMMLKDKLSGLSHVEALAVVDAEGRLINSSHHWPIPDVSVAERDYFQALKSNAAPAAVLGVPVQNRSDGTWTIYLARRITGQHGEFIGAVLGALKPRYFETFFASVTLAAGSSISLAREDGVLLVRYPRIERAVGQRYTGFIAPLKQSDAATYHMVGRWDSGERLIAARRVPGYSLAVTVGVDIAAVLAEWHREADLFIGVACIAGALIAVIGFLIVRQLQLGHRQHRLELDTALNSMSQGLCMFDREARLVLCNRRYLAMYGLTAELMSPGRTLRQIVEHRKAIGSFHEDPAQYCAQIMANIARGTADSQFIESPDGRVVCVSNQPIAGGGWVAMHEDVTERHRAQQRAEEAHARLREVIDVMPIGLVFYDAQDRLVLWNRRYDEFYAATADLRVPGVRFEDMLRGALARGLYPDAVGREEAWLAHRLALHRAAKELHEQQLTGGRWLRVEDCRTADGGSIGIRVEITEIKQREAELKVQNMRFDAALQQMSQGLAMFDKDRRLIVCNDRYAHMYGLRPELTRPGSTQEEILRHRFDAGVYTGPTAERYLRQRLAEPNSDQPSDRVIELDDGRIIAIARRPTGDGGWVSTHEDITERRRAEQERDRNRKFLDLVIENVPVSIIVRNAGDRRYVLVNRAGEELLGFARREMIGKTAHECLSPEHAALIDVRDDELLRSESSDVILMEGQEIVTAANNRRIVTSRRLAVRGEDGAPLYILSVVEDVTERKRADERIARLASYDALTDLPNRVLFRQRLDEALQRAQRSDRVAVLYLDLDFFKHVNDSLGHPVGDELLKSVAQRLRGCVNEADTVARLGGDEFAIIQLGVADPADTTALAGRIFTALRAPYDLHGHQLVADVSIGIAIAPDDGHEPDQLLKNADLALYGAKADGRGAYRFFEPEMDARMKTRRALEEDLRKALTRGEFELYYQPVLDLEADRIGTCEALIRWNHPQRGRISPAEFIPIAEETGLIMPIGEWVLRQACADAATWPRDVNVAVNLSAAQFKLPSLSRVVVGALAAAGLPPRNLELEITESVLIQSSATVSSTLRELHGLGVRFAMDDFGTGYSSLGYLRNYPLDKIKIDRSFVSDLNAEESSGSIVRAIIALARSLGMSTTAEGVETEEQLAALRAAGCTEIQGFLFSRPLPHAQLLRMVANPARRAAGAG